MDLTQSIRSSVQRFCEEMSQADRDKLPKSAFIFPDRRAWPIHDEAHAKTALAFMAQGKGDSADYPTIKAAIKKRYPNLSEASDDCPPFQKGIAAMFTRSGQSSPATPVAPAAPAPMPAGEQVEAKSKGGDPSKKLKNAVMGMSGGAIAAIRAVQELKPELEKSDSGKALSDQLDLEASQLDQLMMRMKALVAKL